MVTEEEVFLYLYSVTQGISPVKCQQKVTEVLINLKSHDCETLLHQASRKFEAHMRFLCPVAVLLCGPLSFCLCQISDQC